MFNTSYLQALRKRRYALESSPDHIRIPAIAARGEVAAKPIEEATLDDLAFAMGALEAEFNALGDRMHAIRKLYTLARKAGALGADIAINAVSSDMGAR